MKTDFAPSALKSITADPEGNAKHAIFVSDEYGDMGECADCELSAWLW